MAGCHVGRIQARQPSCPGSSGFRSSGLWEVLATITQVARPAPEFCNRVNCRMGHHRPRHHSCPHACPHPERASMGGAPSVSRHGPRHSRRSAVSTLGRPDTLTTLADTNVSTGHGCAEDQGVTLHSLRLTHASQLIASGMDVLTISCRLGHASPCYHLDSVWLPDRRQRPTGSRGHGTNFALLQTE